MDARLSLSLVVALLGCSSSGLVQPDGCGDVPFTVTVRTNAGNVFIPSPSVNVAFGCAFGTTDDRGQATLMVSKGTVSALRFTREGLSPTLSGELTVDGAGGETVIVLRDTMGAKFGLRADAPLLWVKVEPGTRCSNVEGVTLSVDGHPEAKVDYVSGDGPIDPKATTTSMAGTAFIRGLPAGARVHVHATKTSCTLGPAHFGALPLENGVITSLQIFED